MNYIKIRLTFNPGSKIYRKKPHLFLMQTQFSILKFLFMDLLYRSRFPKRGISEQFRKGYKDLGGTNTDPIGKHQWWAYSSLPVFSSPPLPCFLNPNHSQFEIPPPRPPPFFFILFLRNSLRHKTLIQSFSKQ